MGGEQSLRLVVRLPAGAQSVSASWGAGGDRGFASALQSRGFSTLRFNFPYAEAGRRMPGPAAHAILTWRAAVEWARAEGGPVWAAGKSYGGRMASMAVAEGMEVDGLIYLGYPLHPPAKPEALRAEHLPAIAVPQLFVEGSNDPFIQPLSQFEEVLATCQDARVAWIDGGGHSFEVKGQKRPASDIGAALVPLVEGFIAGG